MLICRSLVIAVVIFPFIASAHAQPAGSDHTAPGSNQQTQQPDRIPLILDAIQKGFDHIARAIDSQQEDAKSALDDKRADADLRAQQSMAEAARDMVTLTWWQFWVGLGTLLGLGVTIALNVRTAQAAIAAARAAEISANAMWSTERAYLHPKIERSDFGGYVSALQIYDHPDSASHTHGYGNVLVAYRLKNYGKTPAVLRRIKHNLFFGERFPSREYTTIDSALPQESTIGAGASSDEILCYLNVKLTAGHVQQYLAGTHTLWFFGYIEYGDAFDKAIIYPFQFRYIRNRFQPYVENDE